MPPSDERVTEHKELASLNRLSRVLDGAIRIPGTGIRIGLDPILGLIPGLGDWAGAIGSGYILVRAAGFGVARSTLLRMAGNIGLDFVVGTVPMFGDLFDFGWKANERNMTLLRAHLEEPERRRRADHSFVVLLVVGLGLLFLLCVGLSLWLFAWLLQTIVGSS